jgi:hypothetical protein
MRQFYLLPVTGLLFIIASSCTKRNDSNNGSILKKSVVETTDSTVVTHYVYNELDRLVRLQITTNPSTPYEINEALLFEFNSTKRLGKSYYTETGNSMYNIQEYTYRDNSDTIDVLVKPDRFLAPTHTRLVILNSFGQVISDSIRSIATGLVSFSSFTYDAAGNAVTEKRGISENGQVSNSFELSYTYDARYNPFKAFGLWYYLATGDFRAFHSNNIQSWSDGGQSHPWQHAYNNSGLPVTSVLTVTPNSPGGLKQDFYYR